MDSQVILTLPASSATRVPLAKPTSPYTFRGPTVVPVRLRLHSSSGPSMRERIFGYNVTEDIIGLRPNSSFEYFVSHIRALCNARLGAQAHRPIFVSVTANGARSSMPVHEANWEALRPQLANDLRKQWKSRDVVVWLDEPPPYEAQKSGGSTSKRAQESDRKPWTCVVP